MVESARLNREQIATLDQLRINRVLVHTGNHGFVQARRQQVDHVHALRELAVFLGRDLAGDEDPEMADALVDAIDDGLAGGHDLLFGLVEVGDPAQRLAAAA